jgi:hypothetical protein
MMHKIRNWLNTGVGALMGVTVGLLFLIGVSAGYAATEEKIGKPVEQPVQGQQICPATPGKATCQVVLDCPPIKSPGQTTCQAKIDCPATKQPVKTKKKQKTN